MNYISSELPIKCINPWGYAKEERTIVFTSGKIVNHIPLEWFRCDLRSSKIYFSNLVSSHATNMALWYFPMLVGIPHLAKQFLHGMFCHSYWFSCQFKLLKLFYFSLKHPRNGIEWNGTQRTQLPTVTYTIKVTIMILFFTVFSTG